MLVQWETIRIGTGIQQHGVITNYSNNYKFY